VQALELVGRLLAVARGERRELLGVSVALSGEALAQMRDVDLVAVPAATSQNARASSVSLRCSRPR